jgi:exoribonuclease R
MKVSVKERDAEKMENNVRDYFITQLYKDKIGKEFKGMVTGMRDGKCFITLPDSAE